MTKQEISADGSNTPCYIPGLELVRWKQLNIDFAMQDSGTGRFTRKVSYASKRVFLDINDQPAHSYKYDCCYLF